MAFNSYYFILYFLPLSVIGYLLLHSVTKRIRPERALAVRQIYGIILSVFFYYQNETSGAWGILLLLPAVNYGLARWMCAALSLPRRRHLLAAGVAFNVLILFAYKYAATALTVLNIVLGTSFGIPSLNAPSGLSFLVFQQIIYLADACSLEAAGDTALDYLTYITWFPKVLSGPITSRKDLLGSFRGDHNAPVSGRILSGLVLFCIGLGKKVLLADVLSLAVDWGFDNLDLITSADAVIITLSYTFQIYFDFSGYTDMARGISRMMGIELPLNFNSPYRSLSIREFWDRWHMSLTNFLTRYIYIPLGGSRNGRLLTWRNTMIVFLISGLWHGSAPSFVVWGALHGFLSLLNREAAGFWEKVPRFLRWLSTFACVNLLWLLFRAQSISKFVRILKTMFLGGTFAVSSGLLEEVASMSPVSGMGGGMVLAGYLVLSLVICLLPHNTNELKPDGTAVRLPQMALAILMLITSLFYLGEVGSFLYFNF